MTEAAPRPPELLFRPDSFFLKPWKGWGVMRDMRGRRVTRYRARGQGRAESRGATAEQVFTFEDGAEHRVDWEIASDDEKRFWARDRRSGVEARGETRGGDFAWSFHSRSATPFGQQKVKTEVLYTMVSPTTAFSFTKVSWWGLPIATYTTYYEQD